MTRREHELYGAETVSLEFLLRALRAGDPKSEIELRVKDILSRRFTKKGDRRGK